MWRAWTTPRLPRRSGCPSAPSNHGSFAAAHGCGRLLRDQDRRPAFKEDRHDDRRVTALIEADRSWLDWLDFRRWTWRLVPVAAALSLAAWVVVHNADTSQATPSSAAAFDEDLPVAAALWDESVSDTSLLSLMLRASANDRLADSYKER